MFKVWQQLCDGLPQSLQLWFGPSSPLHFGHRLHRLFCNSFSRGLQWRTREQCLRLMYKTTIGSRRGTNLCWHLTKFFRHSRGIWLHKRSQWWLSGASMSSKSEVLWLFASLPWMVWNPYQICFLCDWSFCEASVWLLLGLRSLSKIGDTLQTCCNSWISACSKLISKFLR